MPEIRRDSTSGKWVIFAQGEGLTSRDLLARQNGAVEETGCPMCAGNEHLTPNEILRRTTDGKTKVTVEGDTTAGPVPGWAVRVVEDHSPILHPDFCLIPPVPLSPTHQTMPACGHHEIVIMGPDHDDSLADMSAEQIATVFSVIRERTALLDALPGIEYVAAMVNKGREAGASLTHPHAQIFALPFIPEDAADEMRLAEDFTALTGSCSMCRETAHETSVHARLVCSNDSFVAFVPFAARFPFEIVVAPMRHGSRFEDVEESELVALGEVLRASLGGLREAVFDPPYNLVLHSAPADSAADLSYHWHMEILPRMMLAANFELASDVWVNSVLPETAASILREAASSLSDRA